MSGKDRVKLKRARSSLAERVESIPLPIVASTAGTAKCWGLERDNMSTALKILPIKELERGSFFRAMRRTPTTCGGFSQT